MTTQPTQPENNDTQTSVVEDSSVPTSPSNDGIAEVPASAQEQNTPISLFTPEAPAPSFTDLIEEFRQREERMALHGAELTEEQAGDMQAAETPGANKQPESTQIAETQEADAMNRIPTGEGDAGAEGVEQSTVIAPVTPETAPSAKPQRLVPPPLRPATRIRMPRHGSGRQRETFVSQASTSSTPTASDAPAAPTPVEEAPAAAQTPPMLPESPAPAGEVAEQSVTGATPDVPAQEAQVEQAEPPKPTRRYRFDRREPATPSVIASKSVSLAPSPTEQAGARARQENIAPEQSTKPTNGSSVEAPAPVVPNSNVSEPVAPSESEVAAPSAQASHPHNDRRRRHGHEDQQAKTQVSLDAIKDAVDATKNAVKVETTRQAHTVNRAPAGDQSTQQPAPQPVTDTLSETAQLAPAEIPLEDLPPLEYSELQAASRRRRRRRAGGNGSTTTANKLTPATQASASALPSNGPAPVAPVSPVTPPRAPNTSQTPYAIQSGMTVNQMNQGNDLAGPFQGPEPTPARGSVLPPQPRLSRSIRNGSEAQRGSMAPLPTARTGSSDGILSTAAVNHLANVISQAIQTQSDRMVAELRRTNQAGANVSVTLPPFPSAERVGVFVDVANLLYSARTLRITIDFGKLLDFLRGNRRLVRAHAYTPTSPQPGDDQMFLQAVKGLGYRITTKNYKTFASGAKKADMDLDLCMDVVRLVDARAVDTIVLVSGDSDFIPLLDYCSDHGVRVEVVAFDESMSASLRQSCDLFINLSMLDEIRVS